MTVTEIWKKDTDLDAIITVVKSVQELEQRGKYKCHKNAVKKIP